jgi:hypothetical protein
MSGHIQGNGAGPQSGPLAQQENGNAGICVFTDIERFSREMAARNVEGDARQLAALDTSYMRSTDGYLLLSLKSYEHEMDVILILLPTEVLIYSRKDFCIKPPELYRKHLSKPFGLTTVAAFIVLDTIYEFHIMKFNEFLERYKSLEEKFDEQEHINLSIAFERFYDRVDDIFCTLTKLEKSTIKEVMMKYISFDYSILEAETKRLVERTETRMEMLRYLAQANEMKISRKMNERIEHLNDAVKVLTAITIIMMIPNVIAGHFGMNFKYMPELEQPWAYPAIILIQIVMVVSLFYLFKRKGYL